jgi:hypothetical protein
MADDQIAANSDLNESEKAALIARLKSAWARLPEGAREEIKPLLDTAHQQFSAFLQLGTPPDHDLHSILRMKSYLTDDWDGQLQLLERTVTPEALEITVSPGGGILGTGKYQDLDPEWELKAGTVWLEHLLFRHKFPTGMPPKTIPIPDVATIVLAGDFGTGNFGANDSPSTKISKFIPTLNPHVTIHLGDVYYAGTKGEEADHLLNFWPTGSIGSFTLNSNHEMYAGGFPYFDQVVGGPPFYQLQSPWSFFALENANWIIVGLDSAYNANVLKLYLDGSLGDNAQLPFLESLARKGKKVIVLTHHNGLPEATIHSDKPLKLFTQVMSAFNGVAPPAYWYWGHVHAGIAYKPLNDHNGMLCRCLGHAAIPWGLASSLQNSSDLQWFEQCSATDPEDSLRVFNGFVVLRLDDTNLHEAFYDETGRIAWTPEGGDPRGCAPRPAAAQAHFMLESLRPEAAVLGSYRAEYVNGVFRAQCDSGETLIMVAGSHSENFPYFGDAPWDNVLLVVGENRYQQTVRSPGLVQFQFDTSLENQSGPATIQISGDLIDVSTGAPVTVSLNLEGIVTGFAIRQEGRLLDGLPGLVWHPFELNEAAGELRIGSTDRRLTLGSGQIEQGKESNFKSPLFAFYYDFVSIAKAAPENFEYVWFQTHALDHSWFGKLLDDYLTRHASEEITFSDGNQTGGNPQNVIRPQKSDSAVVVVENRVALKLATLRRQLIQTTDSAGDALFGMREIFEPR